MYRRRFGWCNWKPFLGAAVDSIYHFFVQNLGWRLQFGGNFQHDYLGLLWFTLWTEKKWSKKCQEWLELEQMLASSQAWKSSPEMEKMLGWVPTVCGRQPHLELFNGTLDAQLGQPCDDCSGLFRRYFSQESWGDGVRNDPNIWCQFCKM